MIHLKPKMLRRGFILPIIGGFGEFSIIIFLFLSIPIYIFRFGVILLAKYFRPDLGEILNGMSSIFANELFGGKPLRSNVVINHTFEGRFTLEELQILVWKNWIRARDKESGGVLYPKFQQCPVKWLGFTFYKNTCHTFDIDDHVKCHETLGGRDVTEKEVVDFTEKLLNASYQPGTSPWELHLIQNYRDPNKSSGEMSVIIMKVHHSLADGFSMMVYWKALMEVSLDGVEMPVPRALPTRPLMARILNWPTFPFRSFYEICFFLSQSLHRSPWKIDDDNKEWHQYCLKSQPIPVKTVAQIKNAFGVTFTSVLVSSLSSAISKNFETKATLGKREMEWDEDFKSLYFFNTLPIIGQGPGRDLSNQITGNMFHVPTISFPDPVERLRSCFNILEGSRTSVIPYMMKYMLGLAGSHFSSVGSSLTRNRSVPIGLTNFPDLPMKIEKNGKTLLSADFVSGCNQGCAGVGIMILSYNGTIRMAITAEKAVMSKEEMKEFVDNFTDEIKILHGEALAEWLP